MAFISNNLNNKKPYWGLSFGGQPQNTSTLSPKTQTSTPPVAPLDVQGTINKFSMPGSLSSQYQAPLMSTPSSTPTTPPVIDNQNTYTPPRTSGTNTAPISTTQTQTESKPKPQLSTSKTKGLLKPGSESLYPSIISGVVGKSEPTDVQTGLLRDLGRVGRENVGIGDRASEIAGRYGSEIARVGQLGAGAVAGAKSTGTDVVGRGNAALAAESASNRISALSAALASELQGTGQQLTAQQQYADALGAGLTGANTQQQLGISGLGTAGSLAQPSPAAYGQTVFDPVTGQYTGAGGSMDPQVQAQSLAQQVMSGNMTYDQAMASLGYAGQAGTNFLNNALVAAGANPLQLQAQSAGAQANIATRTTAGTEIARTGLQEATQQYVQMNTAAQFANEQASAVSNILEQTGLNNINSTDYNKTLRNIQERFSDVNRIALQTALQEARIAYTNLLSTGGITPTGSEEAALNTLSFDHSAEAINASIQQLEDAVARRLQAQYGALQQYNQNLGTGGTIGGGTQSQPGGGSAQVQIQARDGNTYGFYQDANGNWVVAQ